MKSNINIIPLRTWREIPRSWEKRPRIANYDKATDLHYQDGWRNVIEPIISEKQRRGEIFFDQENDVVTWKVIDLTEEEILSRQKNTVIADAESRREELIEQTKRRQIIDTFQAIEDEKEAFEVREIYPSWDENFDYLTVQTGYKVTRLERTETGFQLALFFLIQPHTPAIGDSSFFPENAPALWSRVVIGSGGIEVWSQPIGGDGKYPFLDPATNEPYVVSHNSETWQNRRQGINTSEPGTHGSGWMQISNAPAPWYFLGNEGYPNNWETTRNGFRWRSTMDANFWEPGVFGWDNLGPV